MATQGKAGAEPAEGQEKERMDILQKYVSDMLAVEDHIGSALQRQVKDEAVVKHDSQAGRVINNIAEMSERHKQDLEKHLASIGGDAAKGIKDVATAALGTIAGLYDKVRNEAVSKMLRDDYTALNLAAVSYTMLHTVGLAFNEERTATLAVRHLQEYADILMQINEIMPSVVVIDLSDDGVLIKEGVVQQAVANTQSAWQHHSGNGGMQLPNGQSTGATTRKPRASTKKAASTSASADSDKSDGTKTRSASSKSAASKSTAASSKPAASKSTAAPKPTSTTDKEKSSAPTN